MMIFGLIASAILIAVTTLIAIKGTRGAYGVAAVAAFLAIIPMMCVMHPLLVLNSLSVCAIAAMCIQKPPKTRWFLAGSLLVTTLLYGAFCSKDIPYLLEARQLRTRYPLESLADRLAYETRWKAAGKRSSAAAAYTAREPKAEAFFWSDLADLEFELGECGGRKPDQRSLTLAEVHSSFVKQFIDTPGFGFGRAIRPDRRLIPLPESQPIKLPPRSYEDPSKPDASGEPRPIVKNGPNRFLENAFEREVDGFHSWSLRDFINPLGFGYVVDREHVAGFQAHHFRTTVSFSGADPKQKWELEALDLLSLLKHPEPIAYVSDDLPRMEELRRAPVRPLDAFEQSLLAQRLLDEVKGPGLHRGNRQ